ncbi:MAG: phage holin family protein [Actinobacteria bacterium]|nr:phage holin family protein [Actinomycetota bacterium]
MPEGRPLPQVASELWDLVVGYFKQETLDPFKQLLRFVAFGVVGAFLLGCGVILLSVSALRALQTETGDTFGGNWSWAPYAIVTAALLAGGGITWMARGRRGAAR